MSLFGKRHNLAKSGFLRGFTDCHCHLLPGVDDGVQTMDEALRTLSLYETLGFREVWLTPHIMEDMPNSTAGLRARFEEMKAAYTGSLTLHLSAENMLDNLFEERLEGGNLLPLGREGKLLLVETSYFNPPIALDNILKRIKAKGYTPVLAHPERYTYMRESDCLRLRETGVRLQLNLFSLTGEYGTAPRKRAEWLLANALVDMLGTDTHSLGAFSRAISANKISTDTLRRLQAVGQRL